MADTANDESFSQMQAGSEAAAESVEDEGGGAPLWMCTFADLVTLLMCFFVLLFAMSSTQQETFKELIRSLRSALGVEQIPETGTREGLVMPNIPNEEREVKTEAIDEIGGMIQKELQVIVSDVRELIIFNKLGGMVKVQEGEEGVVITISDVVLFPSGEATMTAKGLEIMEKVAKILKQVSYPVSIAGHTDTTPIHTLRYASNWELSVCRATEVVRFLIKNSLDPRMITAEGYAEYRPVADNGTVDGRAQNRRVEIVYNRDHIIKTFLNRES